VMLYDRNRRVILQHAAESSFSLDQSTSSIVRPAHSSRLFPNDQ
jgi:hypothetical protein